MTYTGDVLRCEDDLVVVRCPWSVAGTVDVGLFSISPGDVFYEHYYRKQRFNIFEVYDADGRLKGWYCNLAHPPEISDGGREIRWRDLALDMVALPDGTHRFEDEDEFEALNPSPTLRRTAAEVRSTLVRWLNEGHGPFKVPSECSPGRGQADG